MHMNSAGTSWNTGCRLITTATIMAAFIDTRPLNNTVIIIAMNGSTMISGC